MSVPDQVWCGSDLIGATLRVFADGSYAMDGIRSGAVSDLVLGHSGIEDSGACVYAAYQPSAIAAMDGIRAALGMEPLPPELLPGSADVRIVSAEAKLVETAVAVADLALHAARAGAMDDVREYLVVIRDVNATLEVLGR